MTGHRKEMNEFEQWAGTNINRELIRVAAEAGHLLGSWDGPLNPPPPIAIKS
jgi:hypothetical protein